MSRTVEQLCNLLELPEIKSGRQRSGIATGLSLATGVTPVARLCQPIPGIEVIPESDGTITVRNNTTSDLSAGTQVIVSAIDQMFLPRFTSATAVTGTDENIPVSKWDGPSYAFGAISSVATNNGSTNIPLPFFSINGPLADNGRLVVDASDGSVGWFLEGVYRIQMTINIALLAGEGPTKVVVNYAFNGGSIQPNPLAEVQLDFSTGNADHMFVIDDFFLPSQSSIDAQDPNPYKVNFYVNTNDEGSTFRFSTTTSNASPSQIVVTRLGDRATFL